MAWPTITDGVTKLGKSLFDSIQTYIDGLSTLIFSNTGLKVQDTDASHTLALTPGSNLSANRVLTITTGDSDRTVTISGNTTISQDYSSTGTPSFGGLTLSANDPKLTFTDTSGSPTRSYAIRNADGSFIFRDETAATDRWSLDSAGHFQTVADNTYDLGRSGYGRPRYVYTGTAILSGTGSATAPPLSVDGDTNTGIWYPAADTVAITTGGSERARVTSGGYVGINTTSPAVPLDVNGDVYATGQFRSVSGATTLVMKHDGINASISSSSGTNLLFYANGAAGIYLSTNGVERFRAGSGGDWLIAGSAGTSGQVFTSGGSGAAPSWTTISTTPAVLSKSANYTVQTSDGSNVVVLCTNTITITLYAASGNSGKIVNVKNNGTGTITIDANASELIDGALTQTISAQYTNLTLVCDGTGWAII